MTRHEYNLNPFYAEKKPIEGQKDHEDPDPLNVKKSDEN